MMIGIIKEIDSLGRIVIPKEMRERFSLDGEVEVVMTEDGVLIKNPEYELTKIQTSPKKSEM
jgi:AbrB family looped-hinge helix DNA binding protein